jgi:hypothetical protein
MQTLLIQPGFAESHKTSLLTVVYKGEKNFYSNSDEITKEFINIIKEHLTKKNNLSSCCVETLKIKPKAKACPDCGIYLYGTNIQITNQDIADFVWYLFDIDLDSYNANIREENDFSYDFCNIGDFYFFEQPEGNIFYVTELVSKIKLNKKNFGTKMIGNLIGV